MAGAGRAATRAGLLWLGLLQSEGLVAAGLLSGIKTVFNGIKDSMNDKDVEVRVDTQEWVRTIPIEVLQAQQEEGWCDQRPANAYNEVASWKERSPRKVERRLANDKPYTHDEFIDIFAPEQRLANDNKPYTYHKFVEYYGQQGDKANTMWVKAKDATKKDFRQEAEQFWEKAPRAPCSGECCPRCHEERKEDFWCSYTADRWVPDSVQKAREENAYPYWPKVEGVEECETEKLGCRRKGKRKETQTVKLTLFETGAEPKKTECTQDHLDLARWQLLEVGKSYPAKRRMVYGLLCSTIKIPDAWRNKKIANDGKGYTYGEFADFYGKSAGDRWKAAVWDRQAGGVEL